MKPSETSLFGEMVTNLKSDKLPQPDGFIYEVTSQTDWEPLFVWVFYFFFFKVKAQSEMKLVFTAVKYCMWCRQIKNKTFLYKMWWQSRKLKHLSKIKVHHKSYSTSTVLV